MKRYSTFKNYLFPSLVVAFILLGLHPKGVKAQSTAKFDYIQKKSTVYYAVLELPGKEYIVIGTQSLIHSNMKIQQRYGRVGRIELLVMLKNGRKKYVSGRVMDNGRNTTFHSRSSARQFVRRLRE